MKIILVLFNISPLSFSAINYSDVIAFQTDIAQRLQNEYILTADNFVKMLLVYMRVQAGIPVLIMGETGRRHRWLEMIC